MLIAIFFLFSLYYEAFEKMVLTLLAQIKEKVEHNTSLLNNQASGGTGVIEDDEDFGFPLTTMEQLNELEEEMQADVDKKTKVVRQA